jgi:putative SOS response-associated peptidase YedK
MCGRFTQKMSWREIVEGLRILSRIGDPLKVRYNIRPGERDGVALIQTMDGHVVPDRLIWGFRPDGSKLFAPINAKAETLFEKWPWKQAASYRRCLIPMDGFYEPKGPKTQKQRPQYFFRFADSRPFFVAGIWTRGDPLDTFALITTEPNDQVSPIHDRMPAIVAPEAHTLWLSNSTDRNALREALGPWAGQPLQSWQVDRQRLNTSDDERCIEAV